MSSANFGDLTILGWASILGSLASWYLGSLAWDGLRSLTPQPQPGVRLWSLVWSQAHWTAIQLKKLARPLKCPGRSQPFQGARSAIRVHDDPKATSRVAEKHLPQLPLLRVACVHNQTSAHRPCHTDTHTITDASKESGVETRATSTPRTTHMRISEAIRSAIAQSTKQKSNAQTASDRLDISLKGHCRNMECGLRGTV